MSEGEKFYALEAKDLERIQYVLNVDSIGDVLGKTGIYYCGPSEIEKTLNFYKTTSSRERIDKILLSGGAARTINLDQYISDRFNAEVEFLNPFRTLQYSQKQFDGDYLEEVAPGAAVAVGLALRKAGDR